MLYIYSKTTVDAVGNHTFSSYLIYFNTLIILR